MAEFVKGDRVKVSEFTGEVVYVSKMSDPAFISVRDHEDKRHEIILSDAVKVTKVEPPRPEGQIIRDNDGDVFIYEPKVTPEFPWRVVYLGKDHWTVVGTRHGEDMLNEPFTVL